MVEDRLVNEHWSPGYPGDHREGVLSVHEMDIQPIEAGGTCTRVCADEARNRTVAAETVQDAVLFRESGHKQTPKGG